MESMAGSEDGFMSMGVTVACFQPSRIVDESMEALRMGVNSLLIGPLVVVEWGVRSDGAHQ